MFGFGQSARKNKTKVENKFRKKVWPTPTNMDKHTCRIKIPKLNRQFRDLPNNTLCKLTPIVKFNRNLSASPRNGKKKIKIFSAYKRPGVQNLKKIIQNFFSYPAGYAMIPVLLSQSNAELLVTVKPSTCSNFTCKQIENENINNLLLKLSV